MLKNNTDIAIIIACMVFLCWYLPLAYINVFACDDYWFGTNVRINGFLGNQFFYWNNWEGSYTHTLLASLPHIVRFSYMPFIANVFSLSLLCFSLYVCMRTYTDMIVHKCLINSLYFISFLYLCTNGNSEIRFWVCANITYVSEISFVLLLLSLYHKLNNQYTNKEWFVLLVILFLVAGSKLTFILYAIAGLIVHDILFARSINKNTIVVWVVLSFFIMLNVAAPGNYIRLAEETISKIDGERMSFFESVIYRFAEMKSYLLNLIFLLPLAIQWHSKYKFEKKRVYLSLGIILLVFIFDSIIMYVCFKDSGPRRVYFVAEVCVSLVSLILLNHAYTNILKKYSITKTISTLLIILIILSNILVFVEIPGSITYSKKSRERDKYVESYEEGGIIEIPLLPESHLLLSYFANDEGWLNNIYLPYFQKKCKVVIIDSSK